MSDLSEEAREAAQAIFEGRISDKTACHFCAGIHATVAGIEVTRQPCPRLKRVEWHPDGTVLVAEFWPPGRWEDNVIFPHDVYEEDDGAEAASDHV